jgi:hypothetical protein
MMLSAIGLFDDQVRHPRPCASLLAVRDNAGVTVILAEQKVDLALAFAPHTNRKA